MTLPPPPKPAQEVKGLEIIRSSSSVELAWTTNTRGNQLSLVMPAIQVGAILWLVNRDGWPTWFAYLGIAHAMLGTAWFVWRRFRDVVVHADPHRVRVHEQHALGFSKTLNVASADIQQLYVHRQMSRKQATARFNLVALMGPNSKKKVLARDIRPQAAALKVEEELEHFLNIRHESTKRFAEVPRIATPPPPRFEPTNPWRSLPGDLSG